MRTLLRRRVMVPAAVAFVVVAVVAGTAWYLLSEERRMGSAVARALVARTGLPITVPRATWDGRRLILRDVRVASGPELPLDIRVSRLEIDAGIMMLVSPAGRTVSVVATSLSITLAGSDASGASGIDMLRSRLLDVLGWPGALSVRSQGAELRTSKGVLAFDLTGAKQGPGLTLALTVAPRGESEPLRLSVRGAAALGRALDLSVDVAGSPRVVGALWPDVTPPASSVAGRVQLQLVAGGVISAYGRLSLGANGASPAALDFTSRYDSTSGELGVSRYSLRWGPDVRVAGTARLEGAASGRRLTATADGDAAGSEVSATGGYELGTGAFEADVKAEAVDADRARRLGLDVPLALTARNVHLRLAGHVGAETTKARIDATAAHVTAALSQNFHVGASILATVTLVRGLDGFRLRSVEARLPRARLKIGGPAIAYGLAFENLTGQARLADDRVLFSELRYTQYGGTGTGWVDATKRPPAPPFRGRFEADGVDLARFVRDSGATVARITGTVRYVATVQYLRNQGLVADAHITSTSGGEVSIDAIEGLLSSASVQSESTGILRRALEHLRVFEYESLEGDLRYRGGAGSVDLSLRGKKRWGIFPAPVEVLNFSDVPLSLLVRTLTKGRTP